jgi:glyoxylase-like metal-dependent hydrolase (beta-lactamase superfamily II)
MHQWQGARTRRYRLARLLGVVLVAMTLGAVLSPAADETPQYSVWLVESSRFMNVPFGAFVPDRAFIANSTDPRHNINTVDLPVNVGVIKGGKDVVLYDTGWKQQDYLKMTGSAHWAALPEQLALLGIKPEDVTKLVIGHGHWDHAGQLDDFPNAILYVQREELRGIEWALTYPHPRISAVNTSPGGCNRTPACGYPPLTVDQIYGKVLRGKAVIVNGMMEIAPGLIIHPAHRAHTAGSQLLQVNTARGQLLFGSDVFSSWEAIRDWMVANVQQTDSVQQFLAYEKCYKITGGYENCVAAHEPLSYTDKYPLTKNAWTGPNGSRIAEVVLAAGEASRKPQ